MVSLIGDWLSYIAVAVISIEKGEGALAVAMVMVVHSLPTAVVAPTAGWLADRFDRKTIMLAGYSLSALLTLAMFGRLEPTCSTLCRGSYCLGLRPQPLH